MNWRSCYPLRVSTVGCEVMEPPECEAISLSEAKRHLRIDDVCTEEDDDIKSLVIAAREALEGELGRPLLRQRCCVRLDAFPPERIVLSHDVTQVISVSYFDAEGHLIRYPNYCLRERAYLAPHIHWPDPTTATRVHIEFICGAFDSPHTVPQSCIAWMKLKLGTLYEMRESVSEAQTYQAPSRFVDGLIDRYRKLSL